MLVGVDARELSGRPTGTGRYLRNLLRAWTADGDDRFIAYFNGAPPPDAVLGHAAVRVRSLGSPVRGLWWQQVRLPAAAAADGVGVFFSPAYTCPLRLAVPRVTAVHDLSFFAVPEDFALFDGIRRRALVAASLRASAAVLACSAFTRREIAGRFPDVADRVAHVPLAADGDLPPAPDRADARRRLGITGPLVLTVGAILNRRRLPVLLRAVAVLARRRPTIVLDVVGENRTHPPLDLAAVVSALGLGRRVRLEGFLTDAELVDRYAAADVAVFLSDYEGFGLPALEAMARGVPVVASVRPSLGEVFGDAAALVEPDNPGGVADAIDALLSRPDRARALVERGWRLAGRHSWRETARLTRQVLHEARR